MWVYILCQSPLIKRVWGLFFWCSLIGGQTYESYQKPLIKKTGTNLAQSVSQSVSLISLKKSFFLFIIFTAILSLTLLTGCGGGGGGGGDGSSNSSSDSGEVLANVTIGSDGGTVVTSDSKVTFNIPSGALSTDTVITIAKSTTGNPVNTIMDSYEFTSSGSSTFNAPVTISINYDSSLIPADVNESDLKLSYESNGEWVIISESTVDTINHIVSGQTTHFSKYTVSVQEDCSGHGTLLGTFQGSVPVNVYSNGCVKYNYKYTNEYNCGSGTYDYAINTCINGTYIGLEYECVEFVNRYYLSVYGKDMASPRKNAKDYYNTASDRGLIAYENGKSDVVPQIGDILVSEGDGTSSNVGHVAIVKEVATDYIIVAHQNWSNKSADKALNFSIKREGNYIHPFSTDNSYPIKGWLRLSNNSSDTTAPTSPSVSINNGDTSTTSTSVTLTLSATDNVGVTAYCAKESSTSPLANDTCWTSVTSTTNYSATVAFTLSGGSVGDNTKTVYVWFRDAAGNVSASASDSITLTISDTTAPTSPSVSINNGDTSTTSTSVTLTLSATDNVGVTAYCAKESSTSPLANDTCWTSVTSTTNYSATVSFTLSGGSVGDNTKTVYVWFRDSAGNISASASDSITLTISDSTAPTSPSVLIDSGATSTTSTSVTLTLSATDNVGVTAYYASETSTTPSASASGWTSVTSITSYSATVSFTLSSGSVGDNTKTVYVWFKDSAGNMSVSASDSITLTVSDTTAPSSPSVLINNGDTSTTSTSVTLTLSATDNVGVTAYYASETSTTPSANASGWTTVTSTTSYSASVSFTLSSGSIGDNTKTVYVWFRDSAGNMSVSASDSITLTVSDTTAPSSPSVLINNGDTSTTSTSVTLTLSATDNVGVTAYYASETSTTPSANASGWTTVTSTTSYSASVSFTLSSGSIGDNTKTVYVWFRDSAGNMSVSASDSITLTVSDTTAPSSPSVSINNGDTSTTSTSVTLNLSATDNVGVTGYCAKESSTTPSSNDSCWTSVTSTTSYSASVSFALSSGSATKTVYVWFKDAAGNVSASASDSITLTVSDGATLTDIDGNVYNTVTIGTQVWMKENLKVTKYRNGDAIGTTTPATKDISGETSPKYQWAYDGNESNASTYGRLYTWYAATDSRGLCPTGWHLPTDTEWTTLTDYLGGTSVAGGKLKEAGTTHWSSPNTSADNSSGFTALPGSYRGYYGSSFFTIGDIGYWWSATEIYTASAWIRNLYYNLSYAYRNYVPYKPYGFSVRCVRD